MAVQPGGTSRRQRATRWLARPLAVAVWSLAVATIGVGCGPSVPSGPKPLGTIHVIAQRVAGQDRFFAAEHHARLTDANGTVFDDRRLTVDGPTDLSAPIGRYVLSAFTVFLSDFMQCSGDPARPGAETCFQPTLGPAEVCGVQVEVTAAVDVQAVFSILTDGRCRLDAVPGTAPSGSPAT